MPQFKLYISLSGNKKEIFAGQAQGKDEVKKSSDRLAQRAMLAGAFLTLVALIVIPLEWKNAPSWWVYYGTNTGVVGDTIGGIAGPILNFTGIILIYYSFREQVKANSLQKEEHNYDLTFQLLEKFLDQLSKDPALFADLPKLEFGNIIKIEPKTTTDPSTIPLGSSNLAVKQNQFRQIGNYFDLLINRISFLPPDQRSVIINMMTASYKHWLQACYDAYVHYFVGVSAEPRNIKPEQLLSHKGAESIREIIRQMAVLDEFNN